MTNRFPACTVARKGRGWAIFAGRACLAKGFKTEADAQAQLAKGAKFFAYWAGQALPENQTPGRVVNL